MIREETTLRTCLVHDGTRTEWVVLSPARAVYLSSESGENRGARGTNGATDTNTDTATDTREYALTMLRTRFSVGCVGCVTQCTGIQRTFF